MLTLHSTPTVNDLTIADSPGGAFTITLSVNASLLVNDVLSIIDATGRLIQTMLS